jgi:hypothetical protein
MKLFLLAHKYEAGTKELANEEGERLDHYTDRKGKEPDNKGLGIEKKELGKIVGYTVYLVDGEQIRDRSDVDFTTGGSEARYSYIPKGEVWIEDGMAPNDFFPTVIHEFVEMYYMEKKKLSYSDAHDQANKREIKLRDKIRNGEFRVENQQEGFDLARSLIEKIFSNFARKEKSKK